MQNENETPTKKIQSKRKKKLLPWRVHSNHKLFKFIIHGEMGGPTIHLEMKLRVKNRAWQRRKGVYLYKRDFRIESIFVLWNLCVSLIFFCFYVITFILFISLTLTQTHTHTKSFCMWGFGLDWEWEMWNGVFWGCELWVVSWGCCGGSWAGRRVFGGTYNKQIYILLTKTILIEKCSAWDYLSSDSVAANYGSHPHHFPFQTLGSPLISL